MSQPTRRLLALVLVLFAVGQACQVSTRRAPTPTALPAADWWSVYFTDPTGPNAETLRGGPDAELAKAIHSAQASVDMAVLQVNLWSIRDALLAAHRRGVTVRVVIESDYRDDREVQQLIDAGIQVLGDRREGLMHNKFTIIDRQEVWTGSLNYSISDGYRNNNNLVRFRSTDLARNYLAEFEEMFVDDRFGPGSPANTPKPDLRINGTPVSVCFSPDDGCAARVVAAVSAAQKSIHFLAFSFTSDPIGDALIARRRAGVEVSGVMETSQIGSNAGTEFERLQKAGIDVRADANPRNLHHKVIIVDSRTVITGSYNFTYYAETRNDENLLIIEHPEIAALFEAEYQKLSGQANISGFPGFSISLVP